MNCDSLLKQALNYTKPINCMGIIIEDIENDMELLKNYIFKFPKIPYIINLNTKYHEFYIMISPELNIIINNHKLKTKSDNIKLMLLVSDALKFSKRYYVFSLTIILNFNYFNYRDIFQHFLPHKCIVSSYETIGNVIHLNLTPIQLPFKKFIGQILHIKTDKTIINKIEAIDNIYRNYKIEVLAGNQFDLQTIIIENNVKMFIDLEHVYWCSRLQEERRLLVNTIPKNSIICDPFCGVGPHVLLLLNENCKVFANDLNPYAINCLYKSLQLNNFTNKEYEISNIDAKDYLNELKTKKVIINHFIFNLPEYSLDFVSYLTGFNNFILHCYFFCKRDINVVIFLRQKLSSNKINEKHVRHIRDVSPSKSVFKLEISHNDIFNID